MPGTMERTGSTEYHGSIAPVETAYNEPAADSSLRPYVESW